MARGSVSDIAIKLVADSAGLSGGLSAAERKLALFASSTNKIGREIGISVAGASTALTGLGVGLSGAGLAAGFKSALDRLDDLGDKAAGIGETAHNLDQLGYVATRMGSNSEAAAAGMDKMIKAIGDAEAKGGDATKVFDALGLNVDELANATPTEAFGQVAAAIASLSSPYEKASVAQEIFGKGAKDLMAIFRDPAEIAKFASEYDGLAGDVDKAAQVAGDAKDKFDTLGKATDGAANSIVIAFGPAVGKAIEDLSSAVADFTNDSSKMELMQGAAMGLGMAFEFIAEWGPKAANGISFVANMVKSQAALLMLAGESLGLIDKSQVGTSAVNQKKLDKYLLRGNKDILKRVQDANSGQVRLSDVVGNESVAGMSAAIDYAAGNKPASAQPNNFVSANAFSGGEPPSATSPQGASLRDAYDKLTAFSDAEKEVADNNKALARDAAQLSMDLMTPYEKLENQLNKISTLMDNGLSDEMAARAVDKAWKDYNDTIEKAQQEQRKLGDETERTASRSKRAAMDAAAGFDTGNMIDPAMQALLDYNMPGGGFVGGNIPNNFRFFTDPATSANQGGRSVMTAADLLNQMQGNDPQLAELIRINQEIARNTEMGMVA